MSSSEESVGIRAWANELPGFTGILKQRYSDFLVNEIDASGQVVHLDSKLAPQDKLEQDWQPSTTDTGGAGNPTTASQAAPASKASDSTTSARSPIASDVAAVPAANQLTHTLCTASVESNTDRPESATDGAEVNAASPKPGQPTASPPTGATTDCAVKTDMAHGVASCEKLLVAFGTMCGHSNQQKLQGFLKAIAGYQEGLVGAASSMAKCPDHILLDPITDKAQRTAVHNFFKQGSPLPKLATATVTNSGVSDYGGQPMSVIKVSYEGRGQKRKRDDSRGRQGPARGRGGSRGSNGGRGSDRGGQWGKEWPGGAKKYCRFALGKSNMDTQV